MVSSSKGSSSSSFPAGRKGNLTDQLRGSELLGHHSSGSAAVAAGLAALNSPAAAGSRGSRSHNPAAAVAWHRQQLCCRQQGLKVPQADSDGSGCSASGPEAAVSAEALHPASPSDAVAARLCTLAAQQLQWLQMHGTAASQEEAGLMGQSMSGQGLQIPSETICRSLACKTIALTGQRLQLVHLHAVLLQTKPCLQWSAPGGSSRRGSNPAEHRPCRAGRMTHQVC